MDAQRMNELLASPADFGHEVVLRVIVAPGRQDETVIPVERLDDDDFRHEFVRTGTDRDVGLLDLNTNRNVRRGSNSLVVEQGERHGDAGAPGQTIRTEMTEDGWLTIDLNVTGRDERAQRDPMADFNLYPVTVEEVAEHAARALRFARRVYEHVDPHNRHAGLLVNASLGSLNGKPIAHQRDRERLKGQMGIGFSGCEDKALMSFDRAERISRSDAGWVEVLAERIASRLERRANTIDAAPRF